MNKERRILKFAKMTEEIMLPTAFTAELISMLPTASTELHTDQVSETE
jgi:hypothetical protein